MLVVVFTVMFTFKCVLMCRAIGVCVRVCVCVVCVCVCVCVCVN